MPSGHRELIAADMWDQVVMHIEDLRNVEVAIDLMHFGNAFVGAENDVVYKPNIDPNEWLPFMDHTEELEDLLREMANAKVGGCPYIFADAAASLPKIVPAMMDPPASCPLARAAPDGVYLMTLHLMFDNLWLNIRIHRMGNI